MHVFEPGVNHTTPNLQAPPGAMYKDKLGGLKCYRYTRNGSNYRWELVDIDIVGKETCIDFARYHNYDATNEWTFTDEAGTGSAALSDDTLRGYLRLTTGANDNDRSHIQYTAANSGGELSDLTASRMGYFETLVRVSDATQSDFFAGLSITDTTLGATTVPTASDYIGFAKDDGDTNLDFVSAKDSTETEVAAVATVANDTWVRLGILMMGTDSVIPYVDGVAGTAIRTNLPDDEALCFTYHLVAGEAAAKTMDIEYVKLKQEYI